jgi:uncharacterized protein YaiE (UPF0345 family)
MRLVSGLAFLSAVAMVGCVGAVDSGGDEGVASDDSAVQNSELAPNGRGFLTKEAHAQGNAKPSSNGITYHGGPVMLGAIHAYYIWYGNWAGNSATSILTDFGNNLGGSPYWNINTTYGNASSGGTMLSNAFTLAGSTSVGVYPAGGATYKTALTDADIQTIVSGVITAGTLPKDTSGIYFVLTSADVNATSGFCTQYCGWHTHATIGGSDIKYSFVGNADRCISSCGAQAVGPNGNAGADAMASIIAHEAEEAATDPDLNAWYDSRGAENADKCAWTFGTTYSVNGATANMKLGARDYLIQQNWKNIGGGGCVKSYP